MISKLLIILTKHKNIMTTENPKEQADLDNRSNQLNPNNYEYYHSRLSSFEDDDELYNDDDHDDWADDCYMSDFD